MLATLNPQLARTITDDRLTEAAAELQRRRVRACTPDASWRPKAPTRLGRRLRREVA
jgi:hypothetical protein